jgi:membrane-bound lytic murein transglycosylase
MNPSTINELYEYRIGRIVKDEGISKETLTAQGLMDWLEENRQELGRRLFDDMCE